VRSISSRHRQPRECGRACIRSKLPELFAVGLGSTVLLLYLRGVDIVEERLLGAVLGDLDLLDGDGVEEGGDDLPGEVDGAGGIDGEHLVEPASVVGAHLGSGALDGRHGDLSDSHSSQVVDDRPVLHLSRQEHVLYHLLVHVDSRQDTGLHVLEVHKSGVEYQDGSEVLVAAAGVEETAALGN